VAPSIQRRKVWLTPTSTTTYRAVTLPRHEQLKFGGVPQTNETISTASGPKFTILWGHLEDILLLNNFFPIVDMCLSCEDIARQICAMVPRWRFLTTFCVLYFQRAACSTFQTDMHSKFTIEMWANAQRDGRPAEYMWRPLFNAAKFG